MDREYLIMFKDGPMGDNVLWWRPDRSGYTVDVDQAGRYSKAEAESIRGLRGLDFPVLFSDIGTRLRVSRVISVDNDPNYIAIKRLALNDDTAG